MSEKKERVGIVQAITNIEEYFVKEKLTAHEILIILRDLENTAIVALVLGAHEERQKTKAKELKDETPTK